MELEDLVLILGALGVGSIMPKLVAALLDWVKGGVKRRREAWELLDRERRLRRRFEEALDETRTGWHRETSKPYEDMPRRPEINRKRDH